MERKRRKGENEAKRTDEKETSHLLLDRPTRARLCLQDPAGLNTETVEHRQASQQIVGGKKSVSQKLRSFRWLRTATASCIRPRELHHSQPLLRRLELGVVVIGHGPSRLRPPGSCHAHGWWMKIKPEGTKEKKKEG